jgi:hypothetical protein
LNVMTTRPRIDIAAMGTNQLRRTCETKAADSTDRTRHPRCRTAAAELLALALLVVEGFLLHVLLQVLERLAERAAGRRPGICGFCIIAMSGPAR